MNCTEIDIRCFSRRLCPTGFSYTVNIDITVFVIMIFDMPMFMCKFFLYVMLFRISITFIIVFKNVTHIKLANELNSDHCPLKILDQGYQSH